jgi:outer membrane protein assembly factor BamE (lipoprotein component of BamABCDE complex)
MNRAPWIVVLGLGLVFLAGCAQRFSRERFDMITIGMDSRDDVRELMGEPDTRLDDQWLYDDVDERKSALIYFDRNGRVVSKEWMDTQEGTWEETGDRSGRDRELRESETRTRTMDD